MGECTGKFKACSSLFFVQLFWEIVVQRQGGSIDYVASDQLWSPVQAVSYPALKVDEAVLVRADQNLIHRRPELVEEIIHNSFPCAT